jgi:hypothetical protein
MIMDVALKDPGVSNDTQFSGDLAPEKRIPCRVVQSTQAGRYEKIVRA